MLRNNFLSTCVDTQIVASCIERHRRSSQPTFSDRRSNRKIYFSNGAPTKARLSRSPFPRTLLPSLGPRRWRVHFIGIAKIYDRSVLLTPGGFISMIGRSEDRSQCAQPDQSFSARLALDISIFSPACGSPQARKEVVVVRWCRVVTVALRQKPTTLSVICYEGSPRYDRL